MKNVQIRKKVFGIRKSYVISVASFGWGSSVASCNYYSIYTTSFNWLLSTDAVSLSLFVSFFRTQSKEEKYHAGNMDKQFYFCILKSHFHFLNTSSSWLYVYLLFSFIWTFAYLSKIHGINIKDFRICISHSVNRYIRYFAFLHVKYIL